MIVLGLTGSIGMGKSTAARFLRDLGVPVYDADAAVHQVFAAKGAAVGPVGAAFPGVVVDGAVDRPSLSRHVVGDAAALARLEAIVHPIVRGLQDHFLQTMALRRARVAVLDIPLLFETGGEIRCDAVVVVSAPAFIQRQRVLARADMSEEKFAAILARQMPDSEKRRRADFVVPTNRNMRATRRALARIVRKVESWRPMAYPFRRRRHF